MYMKLILSIILSCFSTAVMSYISMATPIGPWIAPTIMLCAMLCYGIWHAGVDFRLALAYITVSGSIGGILATAFGFSFPTLYFLDPQLFDSWMKHPHYFALFVSVFAVIASWYGTWIANLTQKHFLEQEQLTFPIAQMLYKMIGAYNEKIKVFQLGAGFGTTTLFCIMQDIVRCFFGIHFFVGSFELWPMLWAIGFVTGHMIVLPLITGAVFKALVLRPLHVLFFSEMSQSEFFLSFCCGMVLSGVVYIFAPRAFIMSCRNLYHNFSWRQISAHTLKIDNNALIEGCLVLCAASAFLFYVECSIPLQIYLFLFTFVCAYQVIAIAGKIGLAQLGRFATFVLMPSLFLFKLDAVQIMVISTFVEAVAGVAVDVLCGRKLVRLVQGSQRTARCYQYLGVIVSSAVLGIIFWLLINRFELGSPSFLNAVRHGNCWWMFSNLIIWCFALGCCSGLF